MAHRWKEDWPIGLRFTSPRSRRPPRCNPRIPTARPTPPCPAARTNRVISSCLPGGLSDNSDITGRDAFGTGIPRDARVLETVTTGSPRVRTCGKPGMCLRDAAGEKNPAARFNARVGWDRSFQKEVIQCKCTVTVSEVCTSKARATDGTARLVQPRQKSS